MTNRLIFENLLIKQYQTWWKTENLITLKQMSELSLKRARNVIYLMLIPLIERLPRWFLAGVMIFAAIPKLADPIAFAEVVGAYGLLPDFLLLPAAIVLPFFELIAAFLLIKGRMSGVWISAILILLFITVLSYGIWLGLDIDCGCFGPGDIESKAFYNLRTALVRDLLLFIPIIYCFIHKYIFPSNLLGEKQ